MKAGHHAVHDRARDLQAEARTGAGGRGRRAGVAETGRGRFQAPVRIWCRGRRSRRRRWITRPPPGTTRRPTCSRPRSTPRSRRSITAIPMSPRRSTASSARIWSRSANLVGASSPTQLATIVALDPIYVNFNVNEQDVLRIREEARRRGMTANDLRQLPVEVELQTESGFPHKGKLDYVSPTVNQSTGTLRGARRTAQCRPCVAAREFRSCPRSLRPAAERAAGSRCGAGQRSGRTLRAGGEQREYRRAAQGADRAAGRRICA